ncbi:hypothetical protein Sango_2096000 [Sesamum angolense]|uniref:Uncharacterized protein n=1 Tax=Sesamum angolense TaxID=2727404 RepID=A0AAE1WBP0_9LAMI|nr:hypothetical protein Sango_2096000 [Sesamum angolense]
MEVFEVEEEDWRQLLVDHLKYGKLPSDLRLWTDTRLAGNSLHLLQSLLKKVVSKLKCDWHERIREALWAYRTTVRTPTQATPYALVYRVETVLPLEQKIPSLRIAIQEGLTEEQNAQT